MIDKNICLIDMLDFFPRGKQLTIRVITRTRPFEITQLYNLNLRKKYLKLFMYTRDLKMV